MKLLYKIILFLIIIGSIPQLYSQKSLIIDRAGNVLQNQNLTIQFDSLTAKSNFTANIQATLGAVRITEDDGDTILWGNSSTRGTTTITTNSNFEISREGSPNIGEQRTLRIYSTNTSPILLTNFTSTITADGSVITTTVILPGYTELSWVYDGTSYIQRYVIYPTSPYIPSSSSESTNFIPNFLWGPLIGQISTETNIYFSYFTNTYSGAVHTWEIFASNDSIDVIVSSPAEIYFWPTNLNNSITIPGGGSALFDFYSRDTSNTNILISVEIFKKQ
jgi:hypothetical protein